MPTDYELKFRQDLKSDTGFETYEEWLNQYPQDYPHLLSLRRRMAFQGPFCCTLVDLSNREDSSVNIRVRDEGTDDVASSAPALLHALRNPRRRIRLRVLLWWVNQSGPIIPELLDVCGLGLKIGPQFFGTVAELADRWSLEDHPVFEEDTTPSHRGKGVRPFLPGQSQHYTAIGTQVVTIARNYSSARADPPPVIVIVGWDDKNWRDDDLQLHESSRQAISDWCLNETPPFQFPKISDIQHDNVPPETESRYSRSRVYSASLGQLLRHIDCAAITAADLLLLSIMPLLHIDTLQMRAKTRSLRRLIFSAFTSKSSDLAEYGVMKDERFWLRRHIETSEAAKNNFVKYLRALDDGDSFLGGAQYQDIDGLWRDALHEARMLEIEVRDSMSIQAGQQSLEESKKSIELSNHQIEESRRGKLFRFLFWRHLLILSAVRISKFAHVDALELLTEFAQSPCSPSYTFLSQL